MVTKSGVEVFNHPDVSDNTNMILSHILPTIKHPTKLYRVHKIQKVQSGYREKQGQYCQEIPLL